MSPTPILQVGEWHVRQGLFGGLSIRFKCPHCGSGLSSDCDNAKKPDCCPDCKCVFTLPSEAATHLVALRNATESQKLEKQNARLRAQEQKERRYRAAAEEEAADKADTKSKVMEQPMRRSDDEGSNRAASMHRRLRVIGGLTIGLGILCYFVIAPILRRNPGHSSPAAPSPQTITRATFEPVYRAAKAIQGATSVGVSYVKFAELLQSFSAEIAIVKDHNLNDPERRLIKLYDEALAHYQVSAKLWRRKLDYSHERYEGGIPFLDGDHLEDLAKTYNLPVNEGPYSFMLLPGNSAQIVWLRADIVLDHATELYYGR